MTDTAQGGMTDVVLVTTPTRLITVGTKVALGTELRTPGGGGVEVRLQYRNMYCERLRLETTKVFGQNFLNVLTLVWSSLGRYIILRHLIGDHCSFSQACLVMSVLENF